MGCSFFNEALYISLGSFWPFLTSSKGYTKGEATCDIFGFTPFGVKLTWAFGPSEQTKLVLTS